MKKKQKKKQFNNFLIKKKKRINAFACQNKLSNKSLLVYFNITY